MGRSKETIRKNNELVKKIYKTYHLVVRRDETAVIEKLDSLEFRNGYIIDLIKKDIENSK